ncbi:hypothetical protein N658DRAFT_489445 [Parathielavia hyrcaniae]|uniref:Uncharacterized protein n=1 Tax=Parathielavia hyrcaniae TaxID=113614 RepID=A0AAN6PU71_9PEZI|nr:hypothetical protein N658DRAFT_489445 [Parathielavia hyrcaniae]
MANRCKWSGQEGLEAQSGAPTTITDREKEIARSDIWTEKLISAQDKRMREAPEGDKILLDFELVVRKALQSDGQPREKERSSGNEPISLIQGASSIFSMGVYEARQIRNRLQANTIALCQILRSWYNAGVISDLDPILL